VPGLLKKMLVGCTLLAGGQSGSACKNGFVLPARADQPTDRRARVESVGARARRVLIMRPNGVLRALQA